jgi:hypothetical protein
MSGFAGNVDPEVDAAGRKPAPPWPLDRSYRGHRGDSPCVERSLDATG